MVWRYGKIGRAVHVASVLIVGVATAGCGRSSEPSSADTSPAAAPAAIGRPQILDYKLPPHPPVVVEVVVPSGVSAHNLWDRLLGVAVVTADGKKKKNSNYPEGDTVFEDADGTHTQGKDGSWTYTTKDDGTTVWHDAKGNSTGVKTKDGQYTWCSPLGCGSSQDGFKSTEQMKREAAEQIVKDALKNTPGSGQAAGAGTGEPHYRTIDGAHVTTQKLGEFVLTSGVRGRTIQVRHEPYEKSTTVAAITAAAFDVNGHRVGVYLRPTPRLLVDGRAIAWSPFQQIDLPGGGAVGLWTGVNGARTVLVVWPDGNRAYVSSPTDKWLDVLPWWMSDRTGRTRGLLGTDFGAADDDLTARDGKVVGRNDSAAIQDVFVESWRVKSEESLFDYAPAESTATFTRRDFPKAAPDISPDSRAKAEALCREKGLTDGFGFETCVYDVAVSGDPAFADSARQADSALRRAERALSPYMPRVQPADPARTLAAAERDAAQPIPASGDLRGTLTPGTSRTFKAPIGPDTKLHLLSAACSQTDWDGAKSVGYAFFDDTGTLLAGPYPGCADSRPTDVKPGQYYIKVIAAPQLADDGKFELRFYPLTGRK